MSSRVKHAQRSHKTYGKNYGIYRSFVFKASVRGQGKKQKKSLVQRIAALFKRHQDR
jgi:hypothetical protein